MYGLVLANPPRRKSRRGRSARRRHGRARKGPLYRTRAGRYSARKGSRSRKLKFRGAGRGWNPRKGRRTRRSRKSSRRRSRRSKNPGSYSMPRRRRGGSRRTRRSSRRYSNPGRGMGGMAVAQVIPFKIALPGIAGTIVNGTVQAAAAGLVFFTGYFGSGALVNYIVPAVPAPGEDPGSFKNVWGRPILFGALAGFTGGVTAWLFRRLGFKNSALIAAIASAGPGVRAFGGLVKATLGGQMQNPGFIGDVARGASGLSDFIQLNDFIQTEGLNGMSEDESFGLSEDETLGLEDDTDILSGMSEDEVDAGISDADEIATF